MSLVRGVVGALAAALILVAALGVEAGSEGLDRIETEVAGAPVTVLKKAGAPAGPAVVIAHGFAGSRQLMAPFAETLAQSGFVAIRYDALGHGRSRRPLTGDVTKETGATAALVAELRALIAYAKTAPGADGRVAVLGHSMASDIVIRAAIAEPSVAATVAVSMFSTAVEPTRPANLLIIVGGLERFLTKEALRVVGLSIGGVAAEGETYRLRTGGARRVALADGVDHVGVLYSRESLTEARAWLGSVFGVEAQGAVAARGPFIAALLVGVLALGWAAAALLPRIPRAAPPPLALKAKLALAAAPALGAPLLLWRAPTDLLPILVADYLVLHFLAYGALSLAGLWALGALRVGWPSRRLALAVAAATLFGVGTIGAPIDAYVASFAPTPERAPVLAALLLGAALYSWADALATEGAPFWFRALTKLCFLASLAVAIALNLEKLFFLIIIFPVIALFFLLYGLLGRWITRATGHPAVAGLANGAAFAWALAATFPLVAA